MTYRRRLFILTLAPILLTTIGIMVLVVPFLDRIILDWKKEVLRQQAYFLVEEMRDRHNLLTSYGLFTDADYIDSYKAETADMVETLTIDRTGRAEMVETTGDGIVPVVSDDDGFLDDLIADEAFRRAFSGTWDAGRSSRIWVSGDFVEWNRIVVVSQRVDEILSIRTGFLWVTLGIVVFLFLSSAWAAGAVSQSYGGAVEQTLRMIRELELGEEPEILPPRSDEIGLLRQRIRNMADSRRRAEDDLKNLNLELEQRVRKRTADLELALDELKAAQDDLVESSRMAYLGSLVAGISHEINTPLGIAVTAVSHCRDRLEQYSREPESMDLDDEIAGILVTTRAAENSLRRAADLLRSFKNVAVQQSAGDRVVFELKSSMEELRNALDVEFRKTRIRLELRCDRDIAMDSFPGAISQIVTNLVMNAKVHAYQTGEEGLIRLGVDASETEVIITCTDDGAGMTEDIRTRIYDPFYTTRRNIGGTGLGLHIVYNLVTQKLGGSISCQSRLGFGTTFTLRLPRTAPDASE